MVYTITLNPSLDYVVTLSDLKLGKTNRSESESFFPGGKGVNVSIVLANFGVESVATGFLAGFVGEKIKSMISQMGKISSDFIDISEGESRINLKIKEKEETEINGSGPKISKAHLESLFAKLENVKSGDFVVLGGRIPKSLDDGLYSEIMDRLAKVGAKIIVDTSGEGLKEVLRKKPFLVKPNFDELKELLGVELSETEIESYAKEVVKMGAQNVIVSNGDKNVFFASATGETHVMTPPKGKAVSTVGAGDSMVAGFILGLLEKNQMSHAFRRGVFLGSGTAFTSWLVTPKDVEKLKAFEIT